MSTMESAREARGPRAEGVGGAEPGAERLSNWEAVIGIECHVELKTESKMFCGCPNSFGGEPNTKVCPVCLALPGALPVPNAKAIEHMLRAGLAFGATIPEHSKFDRKNYFYPDMPKNYQISQYDMPLTIGGVVRYWLEDGSRRECRLTRIHLEEDTGKSTHAGSVDGRLAGSTSSLVDFNRAGVPLMECVSEPDIRSADEAVAYLETLARTFRELGVSDVKMEEGSLRCDANVSIRPRGATTFGTKAEIKNMNSFRSVRRAIESEIRRQIQIVESGGRVEQETRGWDEAAGVTHSQRSKEQAHDYRYFPDPDLVPIDVARETVESLRATLPETPYERYARYVESYGIDSKRATQLVDDHALADWFDRAVTASGNALGTVAFVLGDLARLSNESGIAVGDGKVTPEALAELVALTGSNAINSKAAKQVLETLWSEGGSAKAIVEREGLAQVSDRNTIAAIVDAVLAANPSVVENFKAGKENVMGFLVGQVMKQSRGKANPQLAQQLLKEKLSGG
jgi:aspartyl-tRNA(Asn)/glutamyl-tRNA(Gln) amidotransferase subunit B